METTQKTFKGNNIFKTLDLHKMFGKSTKHILPNGGEKWWFSSHGITIRKEIMGILATPLRNKALLRVY